jgi:P4 family phage/plasmid primase-like protien
MSETRHPHLRLVDGGQIGQPSSENSSLRLKIGSDVEIAGRVIDDLTNSAGLILHSEDDFWRYQGLQWEPMARHELRRVVHGYDGDVFITAAGSPGVVKLSRSRIDSILNECSALCAEPRFFEQREVGINCASGFIRFDPDGTPSLEPHRPEHRCRHTLPGHWHPGAPANPPANSLLSKLLPGVFDGDVDAEEKVALLSEVCGSAALGCATRLMQPRAVILVGESAENGKSQILDLARGLLPPSAISSIPAGRMGDERHIIGLSDKLLNASDELSAQAIASNTFKAVVTGEPVSGRDVYRSRVEFRPVAQHLFATNSLPPFQGGIDRGVQRRVLVIPFNRVIPVGERIELIGQRIAKEEPDLLLAWAVAGASRLIRQRKFSIPPSCERALRDWLTETDPVLAWLSQCVEVREVVGGQPAVATRAAYDSFHVWAIAQGFTKRSLPAHNGFSRRVRANLEGVIHHRTKKLRQFLGMVITDAG